MNSPGPITPTPTIPGGTEKLADRPNVRDLTDPFKGKSAFGFTGPENIKMGKLFMRSFKSILHLHHNGVFAHILDLCDEAGFTISEHHNCVIHMSLDMLTTGDQGRVSTVAIQRASALG